MNWMINVSRQKSDGPPLYRMTYGRGSKQVIAMCEQQPEGWVLMGHLDAGPYKTKRRAKEIFGEFAAAVYEAGGAAIPEARRAGQKRVRVMDATAPLPEPVSEDPLPQMAPTFQEPPSPEEIRKMSVLTEDEALVLIKRNRTTKKVYGYCPWELADRKHIIESGLGHLFGETDFERAEVLPHIRA